MRTVSEEEIRSLKGATEAGLRLGGGMTSFQHLTRCAVSTLSKYASYGEEFKTSLIPVDIAVEADRWARSPVIVSAMAKALGYRLVPDDGGPDAPSVPLTLRDANDLMSETMDVVRETMVALDNDDEVDALERKRIRSALREVIRAAEVLMVKVRD